MEATTLKTGDILVSSWGYDQTNINFFRIVSVSKSGKQLTVARLKSNTVGYCAERMTSEVMPSDVETGEVYRRKVPTCGGVRIDDCEYAYPWNGKAKQASHYA